MKLVRWYFFSLTVLFLFSGTVGSVSAAGIAKNGEQPQKDMMIIKVLVGSRSGNAIGAAVSCEIPDGWHIYAKDPGDTGMPTKLWFVEKNSNLRIHWPKFLEVSDKIGDKVLKSNIYQGKVVFPIMFRVADNVDVAKLHISYSLCGDICIPKQQVLTIVLPKNRFVDPDAIDTIKQWRRR